ncbi:MAG: NAD-dependent epimerase/dehydratase family protein [Pseudomonadota bacterium]
MRLVCLGYGFSAQATAKALAADHTVGTTRSPERAAAMTGAEPIIVGDTRSDALADALREATHILIGAGLTNGADPFFATYADAMTGAQWIGYLSTIGVYGDAGGAWVDETTPANPSEPRNQARVVVEEVWQAHGATHNIPVAIIRLAGIYGPGRNQFVSLSQGKARRIVKPGQVFNRIEVTDIGAIAAAAARQRAAGVFNGADDEPAPPQEVVEFAANLMGVEPPPAVAFADADMSPMARSFYSDVKRVSNRRTKQVLGVTLTAPTYREGLTQLWESGRWRGSS